MYIKFYRVFSKRMSQKEHVYTKEILAVTFNLLSTLLHGQGP